MNVWEALILGIVQGATEFLPVSSSGHLVITQAMLGVAIQGVFFEIAVHVATLISVLVVYRHRVAGLAGGLAQRDPEAFRYLMLLGVATVPAGLLGVFAKDPIEALFDVPAAPGIALLVTGAFLWTSRWAIARAVAERPGWVAAFLIGCAQAFALVPGISRAGATVVAALWLGIQAREAAAFSFLMSIFRSSPGPPSCRSRTSRVAWGYQARRCWWEALPQPSPGSWPSEPSWRCWRGSRSTTSRPTAGWWVASSSAGCG